MKKLVALLALTVALSAPAWAATKTVTLSVPSMTCATCPITVKKALTKVEGVIEAKVTWAMVEHLARHTAGWDALAFPGVPDSFAGWAAVRRLSGRLTASEATAAVNLDTVRDSERTSTLSNTP